MARSVSGSNIIVLLHIKPVEIVTKSVVAQDERVGSYNPLFISIPVKFAIP